MSFCDGRTALKVLLMVASKIIKYYNAAVADRRVDCVKLYLTSNIYFNRYPCSSAFNAIFVDSDELRPHLVDAELLSCNGCDLSRAR